MEREAERHAMIREQLQRRNIRDERVLAAMGAVPRHRFVPEELHGDAYADNALPIAEHQTISQPFIVALMAAALQLRGDERVLEVGTGSGYAAAVLSRLAAEVWTIERFRSLALSAAERLDAGGYRNVHVGTGDGTAGWPEHAPYDAITVAAAGPHVPQALIRQLTPGGRLVIPIGDRAEQQLVRVVRTRQGWRQEQLGPVRFVPLVGEDGWTDDPPPAE
jgi:protein-L-isoaspartate(D-aspartate) O-methyltransferase